MILLIVLLLSILSAKVSVMQLFRKLKQESKTDSLNSWRKENKMTEKVIIVKNLVKKFGTFVANDNLSFDVYAGEIFGFLGANGAGKTTAIRILSGLSKPTSGEVSVAGFDAYRQTEQIKKNIGYMCQKFSLYEDLTVKENIILYGGIYGMKQALIRTRISELLAKLKFQEYENRII